MGQQPIKTNSSTSCSEYLSNGMSPASSRFNDMTMPVCTGSRVNQRYVTWPSSGGAKLVNRVREMGRTISFDLSTDE